MNRIGSEFENAPIPGKAYGVPRLKLSANNRFTGCPALAYRARNGHAQKQDPRDRL